MEHAARAAAAAAAANAAVAAAAAAAAAGSETKSAASGETAAVGDTDEPQKPEIEISPAPENNRLNNLMSGNLDLT